MKTSGGELSVRMSWSDRQDAATTEIAVAAYLSDDF
jgi:hypothetical protein